MSKFIKWIWDSGAWIGIVCLLIFIALVCSFNSTPSYADMRKDVRKITNSLKAWSQGISLPMDYTVEYFEHSKKFHNPFCKFVLGVEGEECSKEKALDKGLLPCKTCNP